MQQTSVGAKFSQSAVSAVRDRSCMPRSNLGRHISMLLSPPLRLCFVSLFLSVCSLVCSLTGLLKKITDYFCVKFLAGVDLVTRNGGLRILQIGIFFLG